MSALANKVGEVGTRRPAVAEALRASRAWGSWLQRVLRPRNELENVMRWACGRPSAADLAGADSDDNELAVRATPGGTVEACDYKCACAETVLISCPIPVMLPGSHRHPHRPTCLPGHLGCRA